MTLLFIYYFLIKFLLNSLSTSHYLYWAGNNTIWKTCKIIQIIILHSEAQTVGTRRYIFWVEGDFKFPFWWHTLTHTVHSTLHKIRASLRCAGTDYRHGKAPWRSAQQIPLGAIDYQIVSITTHKHPHLAHSPSYQAPGLGRRGRRTCI